MREADLVGQSPTMGMDEAEILDVARLRDPAGIVSAYVDLEPAEAHSPAAAWAEAIRVELRELVPPVRLREVERAVAAVIDPTRHGRGRALFFRVSGGTTHAFAVQMPLETSVTVARTAFLLPLLAAFDAGRPAGIVAMTMAEVRMIELAWGEATEIAREPIVQVPIEWTERKEPNRLHVEDQARIVRDFVPRIESALDSHGWDVVVVVGNTRLTRPIAVALRARRGPDVEIEDHDVRPEEHPAAIAARVRPTLLRARCARAEAELEYAHEAALAGGAGAVGSEDVLRAATDGRAAWVALNRDVAAEARAPHGGGHTALVSRVETAAQLIEAALATGAGITVLDGAMHPRLAQTGAIARLRW